MGLCCSTTNVEDYTRLDLINSMEIFPFGINRIISEYSEPYMTKIHRTFLQCNNCKNVIKPRCFSCNTHAPDDYVVILTSENTFVENTYKLSSVMNLDGYQKVQGFTCCSTEPCVERLKTLISLDYNSIGNAMKHLTAVFSRNHLIRGKDCCLNSRRYAQAFVKNMSFDLAYVSSGTPLSKLYDFFLHSAIFASKNCYQMDDRKLSIYYNVLCTCDSTLDGCHFCSH